MAIRPPAPIRDLLGAMMDGPPAARWQDDDQLHCTLRFIGEVDRHRANDIADALGTIRHPPVDATLGEVGTFASKGRIHSLWVGIEPVSAVSALQAKVDRQLVRFGFEPGLRAYHPHITIARFSRRDAVPADLAVRFPAPPAAAMRFDELILYESLLGKAGARYEKIVGFPLGKASV